MTLQIMTMNDAEYIVVLEQALRDIISPLGKLRRDADADGCVLNGSAAEICKDLYTMKVWAAEALAKR